MLFQNEAISGLSAIEATIFPSPINMAASWHPELIEQAAGIVREQMRALGLHKALAPVLDIAQDPRWGRLNETYGEDPYLCASIGAAYIRGLQTGDLSNGVAACAKHFLGYSATKGGLNLAEVNLTERDILETFAYPFAAAIAECDVKSIMVTYSSINGVPASINKPLFRDLFAVAWASRATFYATADRSRCASATSMSAGRMPRRASGHPGRPWTLIRR